MTAIERRGGRVATHPPGKLEFVAGGLAAASLVELLVLRSFTRTAIHIPALESLHQPYEVVSFMGRYSYYVAAVLLVAALPLAAGRHWATRSFTGRLLAILIGVFVASAAAERIEGSTGLWLSTAMVASIACSAGVVGGHLTRRSALHLLLFAGGFLLAAGFSLVQLAAARGAATPDVRWLLPAGEGLALAWAVSSPWALAKPGFRGAIAAGAVGLAAFAFVLREPSTARFLLLWNGGLQGDFPGVAYAVAAGCLTAAGAGLLARGRWLEAAGLVLLVAGGIGLHNTYQTGLVLAGIAVIGLARVTGADPARGGPALSTAPARPG